MQGSSKSEVNGDGHRTGVVFGAEIVIGGEQDRTSFSFRHYFTTLCGDEEETRLDQVTL